MEQGSANFFYVRYQIVNIFNFGSQTVSETTKLWHCCVEATVDKTEISLSLYNPCRRQTGELAWVLSVLSLHLTFYLGLATLAF